MSCSRCCMPSTLLAGFRTEKDLHDMQKLMGRCPIALALVDKKGVIFRVNEAFLNYIGLTDHPIPHHISELLKKDTQLGKENFLNKFSQQSPKASLNKSKVGIQQSCRDEYHKLLHRCATAAYTLLVKDFQQNQYRFTYITLEQIQGYNLLTFTPPPPVDFNHAYLPKRLKIKRYVDDLIVDFKAFFSYIPKNQEAIVAHLCEEIKGLLSFIERHFTPEITLSASLKTHERHKEDSPWHERIYDWVKNNYFSSAFNHEHLYNRFPFPLAIVDKPSLMISNPNQSFVDLIGKKANLKEILDDSEAGDRAKQSVFINSLQGNFAFFRDQALTDQDLDEKSYQELRLAQSTEPKQKSPKVELPAYYDIYMQDYQGERVLVRIQAVSLTQKTAKIALLHDSQSFITSRFQNFEDRHMLTYYISHIQDLFEQINCILSSEEGSQRHENIECNLQLLKNYLTAKCYSEGQLSLNNFSTKSSACSTEMELGSSNHSTPSKALSSPPPVDFSITQDCVFIGCDDDSFVKKIFYDKNFGTLREDSPKEYAHVKEYHFFDDGGGAIEQLKAKVRAWKSVASADPFPKFLLITDYQMKKVNGDEVVKQAHDLFKSLKLRSHLCLIVVTGNTHQMDMEYLMQQGADQVFTKGTPLRDILGKVEEYFTGCLQF